MKKRKKKVSANFPAVTDLFIFWIVIFGLTFCAVLAALPFIIK